MAIRAPLLLRGFVSPLQFIAAFVMVITGIFDRVLPVFFASFIAMPIWTGLLVSFVVYMYMYVWAGTTGAIVVRLPMIHTNRTSMACQWLNFSRFHCQLNFAS